ncbi:unnamed protein product [Penicillium nalgiovense]|uniref:CBM-cenC domain-containing protein n=1 Tax=Penicillium nalgiovense TaxID=60175 RepID=A0A9W4HFG1_PENNA|nr:unnamed protein product [Penicillium nalgiovense]CAG7940695.1 unnamed protein product [Penicillium nalgiovense]CAG7947415.1 unnamed protein product [Penicillium nalgiovense]CAG7954553.1 unnamed protein product [Penicillium nalgiovense]CAG7968193.1 unnamed protein product [Penicillium nalgiovense]
MWLAHVLPAVALTITAPVQTTPSSVPLLGCGAENLIEDVAFETIDLNDSAWTILPVKGGAVVDGYLHLGAETIQSQTLLVQTVTGAIAEETYTVSFDIRQTAGLGVDGTSCTVNLLLNGADAGTSTLIAGFWKTISKEWTAVDSEVDMFILIDCPATMSGATVDVAHISFEKRCGSSTSTSVSVPIKTPSGHSSSEGSGSPSDMFSESPSSTVGPITLTTIIIGPVSPASSSDIESSVSTPGAPASSESTVDPTITSPAETPTRDMTTSTVFTTRTATITACLSTVTNCPATEKTTHITTETIVVSTTVCPVEDATTTTEGSSPTGPSGDGKDYTISTILSIRTLTLTQCPATVTDCPARDQTTHTTTETVVANTTSVPINTAVTTMAPGEAEGDGSTGSGPGFSSSVSAGNHASHSNLPGITRTRISSATPSIFTGIHSATVKFFLFYCRRCRCRCRHRFGFYYRKQQLSKCITCV